MSANAKGGKRKGRDGMEKGKRAHLHAHQAVPQVALLAARVVRDGRKLASEDAHAKEGPCARIAHQHDDELGGYRPQDPHEGKRGYRVAEGNEEEVHEAAREGGNVLANPLVRVVKFDDDIVIVVALDADLQLVEGVVRKVPRENVRRQPAAPQTTSRRTRRGAG